MAIHLTYLNLNDYTYVMVSGRLVNNPKVQQNYNPPHFPTQTCLTLQRLITLGISVKMGVFIFICFTLLYYKNAGQIFARYFLQQNPNVLEKV